MEVDQAVRLKPRHVPGPQLHPLDFLVPVHLVTPWLVVLRADPVPGAVSSEPCRLLPPMLPELGPNVPLLIVAVVDVGAPTDRAHRLVAARHGSGASGGLADGPVIRC